MVQLGITTYIKNQAYHSLFDGKRVALIANHSSCTERFERTIDILSEKTQLVKIFSPEHGVYGTAQAGEEVSSAIDKKTNIPIISAYSSSKEISQTDLYDVDILALDIQDVGLRFYTYIYTMANGIKAANERGIPFVVFDRPNPLGADFIQGNLIEAECDSFVGRYKLPQRYGMTIGELARYICLYENITIPLHVIPLENWKRDMSFEQTSLPWVLPSPNIPTMDTLRAYCGTCLIEGTNLSEGRGTTKPMEFIGAPWIQNETSLVTKLTECMVDNNIIGIHFRPHKFIPTFSKHKNSVCNGFQIYICPSEKKTVRIIEAIALVIDFIRSEYKNDFSFNPPPNSGSRYFIDMLSGSTVFRSADVKTYIQSLREGSKAFCKSLLQMKMSDGSPVLLYEGNVCYE